jgi:hypothetical protein
MRHGGGARVKPSTDSYALARNMAQWHSTSNTRANSVGAREALSVQGRAVYDVAPQLSGLGKSNVDPVKSMFILSMCGTETPVHPKLSITVPNAINPSRDPDVSQPKPLSSSQPIFQNACKQAKPKDNGNVQHRGHLLLPSPASIGRDAMCFFSRVMCSIVKIARSQATY